MTPLMAAWLAAIVVSTPSPLAPPPAAATACACRAVLVGSACSLANSAGWASITASSGANFCALASCTLSVVAVAITAGGIFAAVAVTVGGIAAAVAITDRRDLLRVGHDGRVAGGEGERGAVLGRVGLHRGPVGHQRGDRADDGRDDQEGDEDHDPLDPAPDRQAGRGEGRVAGLHRLGEARHPRGEGDAEAERQRRQHERDRVVAGVVAGLLQVDHDHHRGDDAADAP